MTLWRNIRRNFRENLEGISLRISLKLSGETSPQIIEKIPSKNVDECIGKNLEKLFFQTLRRFSDSVLGEI